MLFFYSIFDSSTLSSEIRVHRAGSQLKMSESQTKAGNQKNLKIWNFFENYYPKSLVEGFYTKKLYLEFLIYFRHKLFFLKMKTFFRHKAKLLVHHILWMFVKIQEFHFINLFFVTWKHGIPCFLWLFSWEPALWT